MDERDLAGLLRGHASRHSVPGAAIGILRDGTMTTAYHGLADTVTGERVTPETRFALGSLTKPMVATVLARLAEAGDLSLDDSAATHVPEVRSARWAERATVRDLLANRSRLPLSAEVEFSFTAFEDDDNALSRLATKAAQGEQTPPFWSYTNAGWCVLGRAIETLTGLAWEEAMQFTLFAPVGMNDTTFATKPGAEPRASGHELTAEGLVPVEPLVSRAYAPAGTSLFSTVSDMLRFAALHLEDPSLVPLRAVHAEIRIHAWLDAWCLGWARFDSPGSTVWGWDGLIAGQRSILRLMPEHRGAVVLMTNSGTGRAMYRSLLGELLKPLFGISMPELRPEPSPVAANDLSRFAGVYAWPDRRWEVSATDAGLVMDGARGTIEAFAVDDRVFLVDAQDPDNPTVTFGAFDDNGRPGVLYQMLWGLPRVPSPRRFVKRGHVSTGCFVTSLIVVISPGTGVLYTVVAGLSRGRRASIVAAFGCRLGIVPHMVAAILGLAALLHTSAIAFQTLKYVGVAYLLYLAWRTLREQGALASKRTPAAGRRRR